MNWRQIAYTEVVLNWIRRQFVKWKNSAYIDVVSWIRGDRPPRVARPIWARVMQAPSKREPPPIGTSVRREPWPGPLYLRRRAWRRDLIAVTGQLAAIVRANAPIMGGLEAAALDAPNGKLESIFLALRDDIASGLLIAEAMRKRPRFFPRFYTDLVKVGEESGRLDETLSELTDEVLQEMSFGNTLRGYVLYIVGVLVAQGFVVTAFCLYMKKQKLVEGLMGPFRDFEVELPWSSRVIEAVGTYLAQGQNWFGILAAVLMAIVIWTILRHLLRRRRLFSATVGFLLMHIPFLRSIVVKHNLAHVALVLEKLLAAGVPLNVALEDATLLDISPIYAAALSRINRRVQDGETLTNAMEKERILPVSFCALVSIGESSGLLPEALQRIAIFYQREAAKTSKILLDVAGPAGVLAIGCITLLLAFSWFAMFAELVQEMLASV